MKPSHRARGDIDRESQTGSADGKAMFLIYHDNVHGCVIDLQKIHGVIRL
jgi:hypothetical protein